MRVRQKLGARGSLKFIQRLVSESPGLLNERLATAGAVRGGAHIRWVSPRAEDDWAEYRDAAFLEVLNRADLIADLRAFWPSHGPQWDALGIAGSTLVLVEAKAHVGELVSSCTATAKRSQELIARSINETKVWLGARTDADWLNGYYQLANRLAHLRFFQARGAEVQLVLLQFTGGTGMPTASTREAYETALRAAMVHLGLDPEQSIPGLTKVYVDIAELS